MRIARSRRPVAVLRSTASKEYREMLPSHAADVTDALLDDVVAQACDQRHVAAEYLAAVSSFLELRQVVVEIGPEQRGAVARSGGLLLDEIVEHGRFSLTRVHRRSENRGSPNRPSLCGAPHRSKGHVAGFASLLNMAAPSR
jgi:hypothetical protein